MPAPRSRRECTASSRNVPMSSWIELGNHAYGKTGIRLLKVERYASHHELKDISLDIQFFGAFDAAYRLGDNSSVLPTDTMKNTVYAMARREPIGEIECFGARLADHFLVRNPQVDRVRVGITENLWEEVGPEDDRQRHAFRLGGPECRGAVIDAGRRHKNICASIRDLVLLKTSGSAFQGFLRDEYTTLKETEDRLLGTKMDAEWSYGEVSTDLGQFWKAVRATLLESFALHDSRSLQHTLFAMGEAVLGRFDSISSIHLTMPNRHCVLADLSPFQMDNPNEVFIPIDDPSGLIEATLSRSTP